MNLARVEQIAKAVLYEGYMLYPYRPSSVKNRQRWNFGVLFPEACSEKLEGAEASSMRTEYLIAGGRQTILEGRLRFLHLQMRCARRGSEPLEGSLPDGWQEAVERDVSLPECNLESLCEKAVRLQFAFAPQLLVGDAVERRQSLVEGWVEISAERMSPNLFKVSVLVRNTTPLTVLPGERDGMLMNSLVSTHLVQGVKGGEFISSLEPPEDLKALAQGCRNLGVWPVLVGDESEKDTLLASPIILYDYPQIAPESAGDLFDGTEIDEILSLRILTLTDDEKREMRESDERARRILERTESMPAEQFMKLHGVVRGMRPIEEDRP